MATRGVFQLSKLRVHYCDCGGSSRGARDFIRHNAVKFAKENPATEVETVMKRGYHPFLFGEYLDGTHKMITVKNLTPKEIVNYATMLRNSGSGRVSILCVPNFYSQVQQAIATPFVLRPKRGVYRNYGLHMVEGRRDHASRNSVQGRVGCGGGDRVGARTREGQDTSRDNMSFCCTASTAIQRAHIVA